LCRRVFDVKLEDLISKEFMSELKKDLPNIVAGHLMLALEGEDKIVALSHHRKGKKTKLEFLDVEGDDPDFILKVTKAIQRVVSK